jgi:hypothetical protein
VSGAVIYTLLPNLQFFYFIIKYFVSISAQICFL